jgi:hypothetical protein
MQAPLWSEYSLCPPLDSLAPLVTPCHAASQCQRPLTSPLMTAAVCCLRHCRHRLCRRHCRHHRHLCRHHHQHCHRRHRRLCRHHHRRRLCHCTGVPLRLRPPVGRAGPPRRQPPAQPRRGGAAAAAGGGARALDVGGHAAAGAVQGREPARRVVAPARRARRLQDGECVWASVWCVWYVVCLPIASVRTLHLTVAGVSVCLCPRIWVCVHVVVRCVNGASGLRARVRFE